MNTTKLKNILLSISKNKLSLDEILNENIVELEDNINFFKNAVKLNGLALKYASLIIRDNKEIVMNAVKETPFALVHASERLQNDVDIVIQSTRKRSSVYNKDLKFPYGLFTDFEFLQKLIEINPFNIAFIPEEFKNNELLYIIALSNDSSILDVRHQIFDIDVYNYLNGLLKNKDFALKIILKNVHIFHYLPNDLIHDESFILILIERLNELKQVGGYGVEKQIRDLLTKIIEYNKINIKVIQASLLYTIKDNYLGDIIFKKIEQDLLNNFDFIESVLKINGYLFKYIPDFLRDNKSMALTALNNQPILNNCFFKIESPLKYASYKLQDDIDVVLAAIKKDGSSISFASNSHKGDSELIIEALKNGGGSCFSYLPFELQNRNNLILALKNGKSFLMNVVPSNLKSDKEIVMLFVKIEGANLKYASAELQNDNDVVLNAVSSNGEALEYASDRLKNDREIVLAAVANNGGVLKFVSDELKNDYDIVIAAVSNKNHYLSNSNSLPLFYASNNLKNNEEIILKSIENATMKSIFENDLLPRNLLFDKRFVESILAIRQIDFFKYYWKDLSAGIKNDLNIFTTKLLFE